MANFMPSDHDLRTALIFCNYLKKNAAESHQMLVEAYGYNAVSHAQCYRWFEKFQNGDFNVRNEERGRPAKKFVDAELRALLDEEDGQTQEHLAEQLNVDQSTVSRSLKAMSKIIKVGRWVPHVLTDRQQKNRKIVCEMLLARYKRKRDQSIFYIYELLKPGETVNIDRYKQQLLNLNDAILEKHEQYKKRLDKVIFLDDNASSHSAKPTKDIVTALEWEPLAHAAYSPDLAPSDYHLFVSLGHALADQRFTSYETVKSWLGDWLASKDRSFFFGVIFTNCPKDGGNV
ncbi:mariner Mos1 transposase [Trichonephila clavipes]|nr:mariner Mos1 transposase [Trichonephila clavipes]